MMLQEHSFFSRPFIFFGQNINEEEIDDDEDECLFADPWSISLDTETSINPLPRIGLFIHWCDLSE